MGRRTLIAVLGITAAGLVLRLLAGQQSLFGDELSTLYLVDGRSLGEVFSGVSSDAEITPPLYFLLAWLATGIGDSPELVRLPALLAGTVLIPLTYLFGARSAGRPTGLLAAAIVALAPSMIAFSATGRAYSVMLFFLLISAICLVRAGESRWWWLGWALAAAAAMYSHYTAVFVLAAEFAWALWALPASRRRLLTATVVAVVLYVPWLGQLWADLESPTSEVLQILQGSGFDSKRQAFTQWAVGHPIVLPHELPGRPVWLMMLAALLAAVTFALASHRERIQAIPDWARENPVLILASTAAVATPLAEALLALAGSDFFGARNLTASWPFGAILVAFVITRAGRFPAICTGLVILFGFAYGAVRTVTVDRHIDYQAAAREIEVEAMPGDSVLDLLVPPLTPVPLTPLGADLEVPEGVRVYDVNLPLGEPPFLPLGPKADPDHLLEEAFRRSRNGTVFILGPRAEVTSGRRARFSDGDVELPPGWSVESSRTFPGQADLNLYQVGR